MRASGAVRGAGWRIAGALALALGLLAGCDDELPPSGRQLFTSPQTNPILVARDLHRLVVANTTSGTVSVHDLRRLTDADHGLLAEIPVGLDPVGLARRPGSREIWVANYISDSLSVIDLDALDVVDTIQGLDPATGVTTTDGPVGIAFAGPTRAFVSLDDANQVLVIDTDAQGRHAAIQQRLHIPAQAPRALAVANGKLYVAAFESDNQTEFPTCAPDDPRLPRNGGAGIDESDPWDEGCQFATEVIEQIRIDVGPDGDDEDTNPDFDFSFDLGTIFDFAAVNPNIGGRIVVDRDRPDRDLFVFDAQSLALQQVVTGVGTLLYGLATAGDRVWITNTDARNRLEGLRALGNQMFENRLSWVDCPGGSCGAPNHVDLDVNPFSVPVPTPYGVAAAPDGSLLVVSSAGSDGRPGLVSDPARSIPGLVVLDGQGQLLGQVPTGAIPQGVALLHGAGGAEMAYVLNTVDSTVSAVDLDDPTHPRVVVTFEVGSDPTPPSVKLGRTMFSSARASTTGRFSCESCHPNSNIDQVLWVINTVDGPNDVPDCDVDQEDCPEPRTTMPIRGLRDTLPLHWMGNLADPFENLEGQRFQPEDAGAPDCDLASDGEVGCARHLVNASLSGVMCDQIPGCPSGPTGLPGALDASERDAMALFLTSVSFPPSPARAPSDVLSPLAMQGVSDFFTDEDGLGVGSPTGGGIGNVVGFAPVTCADNAGGCHALPVTASTNSRTVGGFDAPSMRGIWDRFILFSNGNVSSEEWLRLAQACADGNPPGDHPNVVLTLFGSQVPVSGLFSGDPCALSSPVLEGGVQLPFPLPPGFGGIILDPFDVPSHETIYDPAVGMTERGQFMGSFEAVFHLAYGVRGGPMWQFFNEMSIGLPGLIGRQLSLTLESAEDPALVAAMDLLERYADEGRITAVARNGRLGEWRFHDGLWQRKGYEKETGFTGAKLRRFAIRKGAVYTLTAELPPGMTIGGPDRQILLDIDPDDRAREMAGDIEPLAVPQPNAAGGSTIRLGARHVGPDARVLVDGVVCQACTWIPGTAPVTGEGVIDIALNQSLAPGVHVVQMLNPGGWMSNEMPIIARDPSLPPQP